MDDQYTPETAINLIFNLIHLIGFVFLIFHDWCYVLKSSLFEIFIYVIHIVEI